jgi:hypothetical protein
MILMWRLLIGTTLRREITETPVCRLAIVRDPDSSEVILTSGTPRRR